MKKFKMFGITIIAITALALSVGTAYAADIREVPAPVGYSAEIPGSTGYSVTEVPAPVGYVNDEQAFSPAPIMAMTMEQLDELAAEAGYEIVESDNEAVYRQYTATIGSMMYLTTITADMALQSAVDLAVDFPAAGIGWDIVCDGDLVITTQDPKEFFITAANMGMVEEELENLGYTVIHVDGVIQYFKGDDNEGVNIVKVDGTITLYKYGDDYGVLKNFNVQDNIVAGATELLKFA